jgi:molybdopterin synthase catalytic subunit
MSESVAPRVWLVRAPIDVATVLAEVADHATGATTLFLGTVREVNDGRAVTGIDYSAYDAMAEREMRAIAGEAAARWAPARIAIVHRLGTLGLGEASVAIAVAHPRRAPAMDAQRYVIEELKRRVPIWKLEHYVDGTREWVDPTAEIAGERVESERPAAGTLDDGSPRP